MFARNLERPVLIGEQSLFQLFTQTVLTFNFVYRLNGLKERYDP